MARKERIEDLGRLRERISNIMDMDLFEVMEKHRITRPKDAADVFSTLDKDKQSDLIHDIAYAIQSVEWALAECYGIAMGDDGEDV